MFLPSNDQYAYAAKSALQTQRRQSDIIPASEYFENTPPGHALHKMLGHALVGYAVFLGFEEADAYPTIHSA